MATRRSKPESKPKADPTIAAAVEAAADELTTLVPDGLKETPTSGWIMNEKRVDDKTTVRVRIKLTPAVCDICGFDFLTQNNIVSYDQLDPTSQKKSREAIAAHKAAVHTSSTALIVEDLPTGWMGDDAPQPAQKTL